MCLTGNGVGTHKESTVSPRVHIIIQGVDIRNGYQQTQVFKV